MNAQQRTEAQQEALSRAISSPSLSNYPAIYAGFTAKGIAESDIEPRVNVFTFNAWKAQGRSVKKGEHGVKVCTWVSMTKKDDAGEAQSIGRKPRMTTVFHVSQTQAIGEPQPCNPDAPSPDRLAQMRAERAAAVTAADLGGAVAGYYSEEFTPMSGGH